jgi:DNA polymerase-3 subunit epsilon
MKTVSRKPRPVTKKKQATKVKPKKGNVNTSSTGRKIIAAPAVVKKPSFPIVLFDTETTGLTKNRTVKLDKQPEVIEFYAALVDLDAGPQPLEEYYTLIRPSVEYPMSDYTMRETKTKISNAELKDAPTFSEVADPIHDFLAHPRPGNLAHNLSFDRDMIEIELERLGRKIVWPLVSICTVEQTVHLRGRRLNQTALHEFLFQKGFDNAHRAKADSVALINISVELRKRKII